MGTTINDTPIYYNASVKNNESLSEYLNRVNEPADDWVKIFCVIGIDKKR